MDFYRLIANPQRRHILIHMRDNGPTTIKDIQSALSIEQTEASYKVKQLHDYGIIEYVPSAAHVADNTETHPSKPQKHNRQYRIAPLMREQVAILQKQITLPKVKTITLPTEKKIIL